MENVEIKVQEMDYSGTEAYKSLRTNLQFCGEDKKVIAVTSCTPNEGKSSVTMNLAVSMAEAGKKVILIDADMRKSVLVGRTKVKSSVKGLTHYLSKQAPLIDVICSTIFELFFPMSKKSFPNAKTGNRRFYRIVSQNCLILYIISLSPENVKCFSAETEGK